MSTLFARLERVAQAAPDKVCIILYAEGRVAEITYQRLLDESLSYARHYLDRGLKRSDVLAISLKHSAAQYYSFFGALAAGIIPTFMPFPNPKQDEARYWHSHRQLFATTGINALLSYRDNVTLARESLDLEDARLFDVADVGSDPSGDMRAHPADASDIAFLQHSSGTTGLKKGVALSHDVVLRQLDDYGACIAFSETDVVVSWLPLYHDMGLMTSFLLPLLSGAAIVAMDAFEWVARPTVLLDLMERYGGTLAWLPNFAFAHIQRHARSRIWNLRSVRALVNCSEPCKARTFDRFAVRFSDSGLPSEKLQVCYAMAETVFAVSQTRLGEPVGRISVDASSLHRGRNITQSGVGSQVELLSCGRALPGARIRVEWEDAIVPDGTVGEILVEGRYLFSGYYNRPSETKRKLSGSTYRTGDLGFIRDGEVYVLGRADDLIITYGRNYYAHEIEAALIDVPGIVPGRAVALGIPNEDTSTQDAVVVAERATLEDPAPLRKEIKRRVFEELGLQLTQIILVERGWLIKTTSGKINRSDNMRKLLDTAASTGSIARDPDA